jgi:VWFA-related protein
MTADKFACAVVFALFPAFLAVPAQQSVPPAFPLPAAAPPGHQIKLDVVVNTKSGQPVTGLHQQDFTILDNKTPRPITSFRVVTPAEEPVNVIVFIDAVNTPFQMVAYARNSIKTYLKAHEGVLAYPTAIAVLTDEGPQIDNRFSTDGNALSDELESRQIGLREITRSSQWGGIDRLNICLKALDSLVNFASSLPGRKMILWISPGWPLLSGPQFLLTPKQEDKIFGSVVDYSAKMRVANIALYDINPFGVSESVGQANYYQVFLKGLAKPSNAQYGNLGLQVLAVHSGGLAIESNSDVTGMIQKCLADAESWYEIAFEPLPADKPNEYHHIDVRVDQPGVIARARDGYYSNPVAVDPVR